jgi:CHAD domain/Phage integrase family
VVDRFRELEVELGDGAQPDTMDKVLARLQEAGASQVVEQLGKYRRALGDREVGPPELQVGDLDQDASVEQLLRHDLAASTMRLFRHEAGVRLGEDPEAVHQARVGIRRLRSTLRTFKPLLDQDWVGRLRDELKWLANLLGDVRDAEVLHARLTRRVAGLPEGDAAAGRRLLQDLLGQRDRQLPAGGRPDDLVFPGPGGSNGIPRGARTPLSTHNLRRVYQAAVAAAGADLAHLDLHGPHDLRHTFATWLEEAAIPSRVIDELMGHAGGRRSGGGDGSPMGRVYRETTPAMLARVTTVLDDRISRA